MSQPWMPLYIADYLADTRRLTTLEHGAYMLLIMDYWRNGGLPNDDERLARIVGLSNESWKCVRICVEPLFQRGWHHKRIDEELKKASEKSQKAKKSACNRWKNKINLKDAKAMPTLCEGICEGNANAMLSQPQSHIRDSVRTESLVRKSKAKTELPEFQAFYDVYPKRVSRKEAVKSYSAAVAGGVDPAHILAAAVKIAEAHLLAGTPKQYIPAPAVWLNQARYDDEDLPTRAVNGHNGHKITAFNRPSMREPLLALDEKIQLAQERLDAAKTAEQKQ